MWTYTDVELNGAKEHQHGRVSITVLNPVDLQVPKDRADCRKQTKKEDAHQAYLLRGRHVEPQENRYRDQGDNDVGDDGHDGVSRKGRAGRQARAGSQRIPGPVHLCRRADDTC
jgi:hypothetical protein